MLIHGHLGNLASFDELAGLLARGLRVVAYDQRGHGWSESGHVTAETYVSDLAAVVSALSLDRPIRYGQSLGSLIAISSVAAGAVDARAFVSEDGGSTDPDPPGERDLPVGRRTIPADMITAVREGLTASTAPSPSRCSCSPLYRVTTTPDDTEKRPSPTW